MRRLQFQTPAPCAGGGGFTSRPPGERYQEALSRRILLLLGLLASLCVLVLVSVAAGSYDISMAELLRGLVRGGEGTEAIVLWNIRLPRIVAALVTGWALGISGLAVQSLLKNPLASPFTLGISQGAAFGAAFAIVVLGAGGTTVGVAAAAAPAPGLLRHLSSVTLFALGGALCASGVILGLAVLRRMPAASIILAGVALSSLFVSGTILVQYFASETEVASVVFWTFGDVSRSCWSEIAVLGVATAAVTAFFVLASWDLNALSAGEDVARSLGVGVRGLRLGGVFAASLAAALATAFHGVIAFLGLLAPHIGRRLVGADHRLLVPCSGLTGALLLLSADTFGRTVLGSGALPVGVLTSFMGAPLFLALLLRGGRR